MSYSVAAATLFSVENRVENPVFLWKTPVNHFATFRFYSMQTGFFSFLFPVENGSGKPFFGAFCFVGHPQPGGANFFGERPEKIAKSGVEGGQQVAVATCFACGRAAGNPPLLCTAARAFFARAGATTQAFPFSCDGSEGGEACFPRASAIRGARLFSCADAREGGAEQTAAQGQTGTSRFRHANGGGKRASLVHEVGPVNNAATHPRSRGGALDGNLSPSSKRARRGKFFQTRLPFSPDPAADFRNLCGSFGISGNGGLLKISRIIRGSENALLCGKRCGKLLKIRESLARTWFFAVENFFLPYPVGFPLQPAPGGVPAAVGAHFSDPSPDGWRHFPPGGCGETHAGVMRRYGESAIFLPVTPPVAVPPVPCRNPDFLLPRPQEAEEHGAARTATGAGYAGGITSAAPDGIPTAQAWMARHRRQGGGRAQ